MGNTSNNPPKAIKFNFHERYQRISSDLLPVIEYEWGRIINSRRRNNETVWNEKLFRVLSITENKENLIIQLGNTSYKKTYCTNNLHIDIAERFGEHFLGNNIGVFAVVQTCDDFYPLGKRIVENETWSFVSGMVKNTSIKPQHDIECSLLEELEEELKIQERDIDKIAMMGIERGPLKHYDFVFRVTLNISASVLQKRLNELNDEEHSAINFFDKSSLINLSNGGKLKAVCRSVVDKFVAQ